MAQSLVIPDENHRMTCLGCRLENTTTMTTIIRTGTYLALRLNSTGTRLDVYFSFFSHFSLPPASCINSDCCCRATDCCLRSYTSRLLAGLLFHFGRRHALPGIHLCIPRSTAATSLHTYFVEQQPQQIAARRYGMRGVLYAKQQAIQIHHVPMCPREMSQTPRECSELSTTL